jgi:hypothetical protein
MDFWSMSQEEMQLTAAPGVKPLPDVVIAGIPTNVTLIRAVALMRFRVVENTFPGANGLSGAQAIQVRKAAGAWVDAINLVVGMFTFTAAGREGGLIIEGTINLVSATVDGNAIYNFQMPAGVAVAANLNFNDMQVGLRVYFTS